MVMRRKKATRKPTKSRTAKRSVQKTQAKIDAELAANAEAYKAQEERELAELEAQIKRDDRNRLIALALVAVASIGILIGSVFAGAVILSDINKAVIEAVE